MCWQRPPHTCGRVPSARGGGAGPEFTVGSSWRPRPPRGRGRPIGLCTCGARVHPGRGGTLPLRFASAAGPDRAAVVELYGVWAYLVLVVIGLGWVCGSSVVVGL